MTQMNMMNADNYKYSDISVKIIEAFYKGYNTLGYGFLEKVYETEIEVGLLLNFGKKSEFKRKVFSNKKNLIQS